MEKEEVSRKVEEALRNFLKEDKYLLCENVNERSISHKLAEHLQKQFEDFDVDCEYNRHIGNVKRLRDPYDLEAKTVYPDIIVHKRGIDNGNLLVIEIKKSSSNVNEEERDILKLKRFTNKSKNFRYEFGLFIQFDVCKKSVGNVRCFTNGKEVCNDEVWANLKRFGCRDGC